jgi:DNA-binding transcriptional LysR family regulator
MSVDQQHLRALHAIATEGGFSRAVRRLNVSQPTLSQQLKLSEERHQVSRPVDQLVLAMPADHPDSRLESLLVSALAGARLLPREPASRTRSAAERLLAAAEVASSDVIQLHTRETIR